MTDSLQYLELMGSEDEAGWLAEKYNVRYEFLPERLKDG